ncbi:SPFH domain-containing protein [Aquimarina algiphila]|uniref:SPFH domain-containing protein n=1 Tax=Aquimarina algiphila TaxID=2047982 RepID=A0A554VE45_9FLAO|nr:SPFH domain-containing protein [Aquimarina algiphila]TSE05240.1 SPFH domain-containing protein [Aquimarina algiphila]
MNWIKELIDYLTNSFKFWEVISPWESGLRIRLGKHIKKIDSGIHFKIPFIDSIYVQTIRMRVVSLSPQTITTKDNKTLTISAAVGYSIDSVEKLYNTLHQPQVTIVNIIKGEISKYISENVLWDCTQEKINEAISDSLKIDQFGLKYHYVKIMSYAVVRTFRLIQDQEWNDEDITMDKRD